MTGRRVAYLDALRTISAFFVVMIHVCAQRWPEVDPGELRWQALNFYDSLSRFAVPVFFMITGAVFLDAENGPSVRRVFTRYLPRLAVIYVVWNIPYVLIQGGTASEMINHFLFGHYQMWFIPAVMGGYLAVPIFRAIVRERRTAEYFLVLAAVITLLFPLLENILPLFFTGTRAELLQTAIHRYAALRLDVVSGHLTYLVLGYYLAKTELSLRARKLLYAAAFAGFAVTAVCTALLSGYLGRPETYLYDSLSPTTAVTAAGVFVWFKYHVTGSSAVGKALVWAAPCTLGVYLLHPFFLDTVLDPLGFDSLSFTTALSVPALTASVFALSLLTAWVFRKIPKIGKYLM